MAFDSAADLLFNIGANSDDAEENVARFRQLLSTDLNALGDQFTEWSEEVFGHLNTVKGALLGVTAAGAAAAVAVVGFAVETAGKFEQYAIAVGDAAQKTGLTTQELSAMHLAADELGVGFDQVTTGIVRFERSVFAAQDPTSKQAQTLRQMGFSTEQVQGAMTNITPFLEEFGKKFAALPAGPEKTGVALEFMSRSGANNIKFLQVWAAQAEEFRKKAEALGLELSPADVLKAREYQAAVKDLHSQWEAFEMFIGSRAIPMLTKTVEAMSGLWTAFKMGPTSLMDLAGKWAVGFTLAADETTRLAKAANDLGNIKGIPLLSKPGKIQKVAEDFHALTDRAEEMRLKLAELQGPEAKLAEEIAQMGLKTSEATAHLNKLLAEHKLAPGVYERESAAWAELAAMVTKYQEAMVKSFGDKDLAAIQTYMDGLAEAKKSLQEKIDGLSGDNSYERRRSRIAQEIEAERQKYADEGRLDAQMEDLLVQQKAAGLARIDAEQKQAYDREMAAFQDHLQHMLEADMTAEQKLAAQHQLEADKLREAAARAASGATPDQAIQIANQYLAAQIALLTQYENKLQELRNSKGFEGVFGNQFVQMIKQNESLSKEWSQSTNQSAMLVEVALESLKEMGGQAFDKLAQGMGGGIANALVYSKSIGEAMRAAATSTLESIAAQAMTQAIFSLAWGFLDLSQGNVAGADAAFEAAALFGSVGLIAGVAGRAIAPASGGSGGGARGGGGSSGGYTGGPGTIGGGGSGAGSPQATGSVGGVTVHVYGHVFGVSGIEELASALNNAVQNRDVRLVATQVRSTTPATF